MRGALYLNCSMRFHDMVLVRRCIIYFDNYNTLLVARQNSSVLGKQIPPTEVTNFMQQSNFKTPLVTQLVNNYFSFYGTHKLINTFTRACYHCVVSQTNPGYILLPYLPEIHFGSILPSAPSSSEWCFLLNLTS
jgi:hypothetical protein